MPSQFSASPATSPTILIVGAGPSGIAAAIAAAMRGLSAEVIDSREPPIDKACGEGLLPGTIEALTQLGIDTSALYAAGVSLSGISFVRDSTSFSASFPDSPGLGIRRTELHWLLLQRALALGVRFHWKTVAIGLTGTELHTNRGSLHADWIIAADGHHSRLRALAGFNAPSAGAQRIALRQHFTCIPWTNQVEVHWAEGAQAYVTPVAPSEICVVFIGSRRFTSAAEALTLFPNLSRRLAHATMLTPSMGAVTSNRRLLRVTRCRIALIGDASGSVDAITGEGLDLCFRQALSLARAIEARDLFLYEKDHARLHRLPLLMSHAMLLMNRHPYALAKAFRSFERRPHLFSSLLDLHIRHTPLRLLGSGGLAASLFCLLAP